MKFILNYRKGNQRLKEGILSQGHEVLENILDADVLYQQKADAVIFEFKYIFKDAKGLLPLILGLKRRGIPIVTWNVDSPWNAGISPWKVKALLRSRLMTVYATHSLQDTDDLKHLKVLYLPNAAWTSVYNLRNITLEDLRSPDFYKWDVSFIGNIDSHAYPEHRKRADFLSQLGSILKRLSISFLFTDSKGISYNEQVEIIQRSKINLSCITAADSKYGFSWGLSERCYGIPACGGFLLMEDRVHVKDDFIVGKEVVTYSDMEDCKEKILFYLRHNHERRKIAENAYQRIMREHTYSHRAARLITEIKMIKECL